MDDIYDNLENYEDVNDVIELKNENKELKLKLGEFSSKMNHLQKDFDKLNSEYKKLEFNYSSLLKTARAEIERKGEMIKNLNSEKDKLIINALESKGKYIPRNSSHFSENKKKFKHQNYYDNTDKSKQKQNYVELKDNYCGNKIDRLDTGASSLPTISNAYDEKKPISNTTNVDNLLNIDKHGLNNTEMKENISRNSHKDDIHSNKTSSSQRIPNRRKSMPSCQEANFSSGEETEKLYVKNIRKSPPKNLRQDSRDYRTDLLHSHGSSESSRSRYSNHMDYASQRHNDYEMKQYHRNYSPERYQSRHSDYNRQRILKSPPADKYNHSKSRDRWYNSEREFHYDRHRHFEHTSLKHKMRNTFDEPSSKRLKTELYSKCPSQDSNYISDREKEFSDRRHISEPEYDQFSCRSPDYIHSDNHFPHHLIKEIRNTAATSLEDPRTSSKKYILQSYNDQTFLFIPSARDIDILCLNKTLWGVQNVKVPEALKKQPFSVTESEDYLNVIYDNMEDNQSIESGEIQSLEDDVILPTKICGKQNNLDFNVKCNSSDTTDTGQKINKTKVRCSGSSTIGCKIPKIKKLQDCSKNLEINTGVVNVDIKKTTETNRNSKEPETKLNQGDKKNKEILDHALTTDKLQKTNSSKPSILDKMIQDNMTTVEGDLELSDEESDTMEFQKHIEQKKLNVESSQPPNVTKKVDKSYANSNTVEKKEADVPENQVENNDKQYATEQNVKEDTSSSKKRSSKDSSRESGKKRRSKNKSESKETTSKERNKDKKKSSEKSSKRKAPELNISKFSDLFGDTSSLITPDDLGIPESDSKMQQDVKYSSMFESTQDAINVENVEKGQVNSTSTNFNATIETLPNDKDIGIRITDSSNFTVTNDENPHLKDNYENSKGETSVETSNVVKTVIISTGVQPKRDIDNNFPELPVLNMEKNNIENNIKDALSNVNVLATSTPYKSVLNEDKMISSQDSDTINSSNVSVGLSSSNVNNSLTFNTNLNQNEDVPDLRIIVRRKRKIIRKPTI